MNCLTLLSASVLAASIVGCAHERQPEAANSPVADDSAEKWHFSDRAGPNDGLDDEPSFPITMCNFVIPEAERLLVAEVLAVSDWKDAPCGQPWEHRSGYHEVALAPKRGVVGEAVMAESISAIAFQRRLSGMGEALEPGDRVVLNIRETSRDTVLVSGLFLETDLDTATANTTGTVQLPSDPDDFVASARAVHADYDGECPNGLKGHEMSDQQFEDWTYDTSERCITLTDPEAE